jgi:type II secretory pathway component PulK
MLYAGVSSDVAMDSFFTVYGDAGININMAPVPVIAALDPGTGSDVAEAVAAFRLRGEIKNAEDLENVVGFSSTAITRLKNVLNYKSEFFLVNFRIERHTTARNFEIIVRRGGSGCEIISWRE